jgi:hypothetical protein
MAKKINPAYIDMDERRDQVLRDLDKDGYPSEDQWVILIRALCCVIGRSETLEDLNIIIGETRGLIDQLSKEAFKVNQDRRSR